MPLPLNTGRSPLVRELRYHLEDKCTLAMLDVKSRLFPRRNVRDARKAFSWTTSVNIVLYEDGGLNLRIRARWALRSPVTRQRNMRWNRWIRSLSFVGRWLADGVRVEVHRGVLLLLGQRLHSHHRVRDRGGFQAIGHCPYESVI